MRTKLNLLFVMLAVALLGALLVPAANADLYIGTFWGGGVWHLTNDGTIINRYDGISTNNQIAFGPDGDLYANDSYNGSIKRINPLTMADKGTIFSMPNSPMAGMTFGPDGDLYLGLSAVNGDWGYRKMLHIAGPTKSNAFTELTPKIDGTWPLYRPGPMAIAPNGDLYIYDYEEQNGGVVQRWTGDSARLTGRIYQGGVPVVGPDGNIYVGANSYQGAGGANPDALIGQFLDLTGSGMSTPWIVAFNPEDGDIYAHDMTRLCRFGGLGKANEGKYMSTVIADMGAAGIGGARYMLFTPGPAVPEPSSLLALATALVGAIAVRRRMK